MDLERVAGVAPFGVPVGLWFVPCVAGC